MNVGILTMSYRRNYGGVLQSYALFKTINGMGHDVEIIDFEYDSIVNKHLVTRIKRMPIEVLKKMGFKNRHSPLIQTRELPDEHVAAFKAFKNKYIKYSKTVTNNNLYSIANDYDAIVVGSDQVWNNVEGNKLYYFFDFGKPFKGRKIAYAPCSVHESVPFYNRCKLKRLLGEFDALSVRDQTTANMVKQVSALEAKIVLDPTCLYSFTEFSSLPPLVEGDYIFAYILGSEIKGGHKSVIQKIYDKYGKMKVVAAIIPNVALEVEKFADKVMYNATPADWVNLIAHSKFVYTDSFHGCMFAMKYHKPFFAYYKDANRSSRLRDIKNQYGLSNIFMSGESYVINEVDYLTVDKLLEEQRKESLGFLTLALS